MSVPNEPEESVTPTTSVSAPEPGQAKIPFLAAGVVLIFALVVGAWAAYVWVTGPDGFDVRRFAFLGPQEFEFVQVNGQVFFNGDLVIEGHLEAVPQADIGDPDRIIAPIKSDGTFQFFTDYGGKLNDGIPAGEYKLLLQVFHPSPGLGAPSPKLPAEYYDVQKTPMSMTVKKDGENHFIFKETGEIQPDQARRGRPPERESDDQAAPN